MKPTSYSFNCLKACRSYLDPETSQELWTISVKASNLPLGFTLGPNARYAKLSAKPVKEMLATLRANPDSFVFKNNGIMLVVDSLQVKDGFVKITCNEPEDGEDFLGHGVLNGGHTYEALKFALNEAVTNAEYARAKEATVILTVGLGIEEDAIWRISQARNTSEKVPLHALRELAGDWSILKKYLPEASSNLVAFKPNDPVAFDAPYDVTDLVRLLALLNNELFPAEKNKHPVPAYVSINSLVRQFNKEDFLKIATLLPDAIRLEELVYREWGSVRGKGPGKIDIGSASGVTVEPTKLLSGATVELSLPAPFVLPAIAAFRVFIKSGRWSIPLDELWERYGSRTVVALWEAYREQGKSSPAYFGRNKSSWSAVCDLTKSNAIQAGLLLVE